MALVDIAHLFGWIAPRLGGIGASGNRVFAFLAQRGPVGHGGSPGMRSVASKMLGGPKGKGDSEMPAIFWRCTGRLGHFTASILAASGMGFAWLPNRVLLKFWQT